MHTSELSSVSSVGIFWAVQSTGSKPFLLDHRCSLREAELYGRMLTCAHGHYDVWEEWREGMPPCPERIAQVVAISEYEEWPRGRIVYNPTEEQFTLYADSQILARPELVEELHEKFGLPPNRTLRKTDEHYRSKRELMGDDCHE